MIHPPHRSSRSSGALMTLRSASFSRASATVQDSVSTSTARDGGGCSGRPTCRDARNSPRRVVASLERICASGQA